MQLFGIDDDADTDQAPVRDFEGDHARGTPFHIADDTRPSVDPGRPGEETGRYRAEHPEEEPSHPLGAVDRISRSGHLAAAVRPEGDVLGE